MANFNFLPPKKTETDAQTRKRKQLIVASLVCLFVTGFLGLAAYGLDFYQQRQIEDLSARKTKLESLLKNSSETVGVLIQVHRKTAGIKFILSSQFDYSNSFKNFFQLLPSGINAETIDLSSDGKLKASLTASSSAALKDLVNQVTLANNKYSAIKLGDIKSGDKEGYKLELEMVVGSK